MTIVCDTTSLRLQYSRYRAFLLFCHRAWQLYRKERLQPPARATVLMTTIEDDTIRDSHTGRGTLTICASVLNISSEEKDILITWRMRRTSREGIKTEVLGFPIREQSNHVGSFVLAMQLYQDNETSRVLQRTTQGSFNLLAELVGGGRNK